RRHRDPDRTGRLQPDDQSPERQHRSGLHARLAVLGAELRRLLELLRFGRRGRRRLSAERLPAGRHRLVLQRAPIVLGRAERLGKRQILRPVPRMMRRAETVEFDRTPRSRTMTSRLLPTGVALATIIAAVALSAPGRASDVGVIGASATFSTNSALNKHSAVSTQKGGNVHVGATPNASQISGRFDAYYIDAPGNGSVLTIPAPWSKTTPTV